MCESRLRIKSPGPCLLFLFKFYAHREVTEWSVFMILKRSEKIFIVLPENPTERELFAKEELSKYLKASLDAFVENANDCSDEDKNYIVVGCPKTNRTQNDLLFADECEIENIGSEGFLIKSIKDNIILIAGAKDDECERGCIYGVYEFLERFVGCTLAAFSEPTENIGEIVPEHDVLTLNDIYCKKASADRPYRTAIIQYSDAAEGGTQYDKKLNIPFFDWLLKNRYNRVLTWTSIYERFKKNGMLREAERRGLRFTVGHHEASRLFLPAFGNEHFEEHYYETHPEYFKLLENGERFRNTDHWGQWIFCSRNEDAINEVSKNVTAWLKENPAVDILAFWPNDGTFPQCLCCECQKYSKTENYCYFVNEVAKRVKKHHPKIKFDMLIYTDLWECPEGMKLDECILIDESTWHISGLRTVGKPDGTSLIGTFFEDNLKNWRNTGAQTVYYDYYMGVYALRQRWIPMADELQSLWKRFVELDFAGSGTQIECFNLWNHLFNFYCFARVGYDTDLSMEDCLASFTKLFGKGGKYVADVIRYLESVMDGQTDIQSCGHYLMEHCDKEKVYELFENALTSAETTRFRNNVRLLRMVFRYSDIETQEKESYRVEYHKLEKEFLDESGELGKMTDYDSFYKHDPGYAITFPLISKNYGKYTEYDKWYDFEK